MQPVFQIPGDLLESHIARLRKSPAIQSCEGILHACLFLTGLRVATHYCRAAQSGSEFFTNWEPSHYLDDRLETMARRSLKFLMRKVRSRGIEEDTRIMFPDGAPNPNLFAVQLSFANLLSRAPKTVLTWISSGDPTENKIRLSCAMGVLLFGHPIHSDLYTTSWVPLSVLTTILSQRRCTILPSRHRTPFQSSHENSKVSYSYPYGFTSKSRESMQVVFESICAILGYLFVPGPAADLVLKLGCIRLNV
jgi:hypothetical protein